jgi:hypothetical protein
MKLGIKVGPQQQSITDVDETHAPFVEVWFNIGKKDDYRTLFSELNKRNIEIGLHFWGNLPNGIWTNIAHTDLAITKPSVDLIKETIDIAASEGCVYVNIHPGARSLSKINFDTESFELLTDPISYEESENIFFENIQILTNYAKERNIVFTIETIPCCVSNGWRLEESRLNAFSLYELLNSTVVKAATRGFTIANDFGHTAAGITSENRSKVLETVWSVTHQMFANTRLLHVGFVIPPYNGTDFHNHFDHPLFDTPDAVPNRSEMKQLLSLFKNRDDVWALAEPDGQHPKNYFYLKKLLVEI